MKREFDDLSARIIAAAIEVHKVLGPGFLESVYENALVIALQRGGLRLSQQLPVDVVFDGIKVGTHIPDLVVDDRIIVELKAIKAFEDIHYATVRSYLRATGKTIGLLLNFNAPTLQIKRIVLGYNED